MTQEQEQDIKTFNEMVSLANSRVKCKDNPDFENLYKIRHFLKGLNKLTGLEKVKEQLMYQIFFCIQNFNQDECLHTALMGPPGVGKTTLAYNLASIYKGLGLVSRGKLIVVGREDLIGQYLGETAIKTRRVLENSIGNVLFIDEAYSLGNTGSGDSYSKECIDTITKFIGEHTENFICIIAGYEQQLYDCFFKNNPGLDRRFPWKYTLDTYKPKELTEIFKNMLINSKWKIRNEHSTLLHLEKTLELNLHLFNNNAGDIQTFIYSCKLAHSRRVFGNIRKSWKQFISIHDIKNGLILYKAGKKKVSSSVSDNLMLAQMYT